MLAFSLQRRQGCSKYAADLLAVLTAVEKHVILSSRSNAPIRWLLAVIDGGGGDGGWLWWSWDVGVFRVLPHYNGAMGTAG